MTDKVRPSFEMSIDTRMVYDRLKKAKIDDVVDFAQLSEVLGRTVAGADPNVQSAIRRLLKTDGVVYANVRGVGYKRLNDIDIVGTAESAREGMRRRAKKAVRVLTSVNDFPSLPNDIKIRHNAAVSGFGAIAVMLTSGSMKKIEEAVKKQNDQLPLAKTLEAFK